MIKHDFHSSNPFYVWCPLLESSVTEKADLPCFAGGGAAGGGDPRDRKGTNETVLGHAAIRRAAGLGTISVATEPVFRKNPSWCRIYRDYANPAPGRVHDVVMRQGLWIG